MDENSGNTTDKRNWRERLGIGKTAATTDLPKLSGDFKASTNGTTADAPKPGLARPAAHTPVKVAPMAPRPAARPATATPINAPTAARPTAQRSPTIPADNLAGKLRDQREAAEKLAIQRVQAAKQRAEAALVAPVSGGKPKFTFADEAAAPIAQRQTQVTQPPLPQQSAAPARPAAVQPPLPPQYAPQPQPYFPPQAPAGAQMQPPRPQLGANPGYAPPPGYALSQQGGYAPAQQPYQPQQYQPQFPNQGFQGQQPAYRPIDPQTGYAPQPGFNPGPRPGFQPQQPLANPRPVAPQRAGFQPPAPSSPRFTNPPRSPKLPGGPAISAETESDDVFESPTVRAPRLATANEYQQAYRDEVAYDDEAPRSSKLGIILGLVLLALLTAFGAIYAYSHYAKTARTAANVPVVAAPQTPTKAVPDATANGQPADAGKKLIYDRIEGDHEILGGQLKSNEEAPQQPQGSGTNAAPATGSGDSVPLPLPPPPGTDSGQQGALVPEGKTDSANFDPAAGQSSAANSSATAGANQQAAMTPPSPSTTAASPGLGVSAVAPAAAPPPPSGIAADKVATPSMVAQKPSAENIDPAPAKPAAPIKKPDAMKKLVLGKRATKSPSAGALGANPVVLVPAGKLAPAPVTVASNRPVAAPTGTDNSLYGDAPLATPPTLAPLQKLAIAPPTKPIAAAPASPAPATGAYVVQLASFNSKADANAEYQRLAAKHGAIITRYAPIIQSAQVAGSTRFRLNLGPMPSNDVASSLCSSLIAAGERDCLIKRQ